MLNGVHVLTKVSMSQVEAFKISFDFLIVYKKLEEVVARKCQKNLLLALCFYSDFSGKRWSMFLGG
jgi:hypothetical protein